MDDDAGPGDDERRTRVLWLIKGLGAGGAERLLTLAARLHDRGSWSPQVAYLLPWKDALVADVEREGVPVRCLGSGRPWDVRWVARLRRILRDERIDIVHSHSPVAAAAARLVAGTLPAGSRPRLVTTEHNVWDSHHRLTAAVNHWTASRDDARIAVSAAVRDSMPARRRTGTEVVHHGVDVAAVRAHRDDREPTRAALGIGPDEVLVGTVANLRANKAYPDLLEAASAVVARVPGVRFVAVGQGPLEAEIRELHARLGLGDRMLILGYRDDPLSVLSACDVFCMASRHEGLPIAMMEAMALGLPVVATAVGGVPDLVTTGCEGLLVPPGDPDALAAALVEVVSDPSRREAMSAAVVRRSADLDVTRAIRRIEAIYEQVLAG